jgi:putative ATP-dependent endonuclease of OLD family
MITSTLQWNESVEKLAAHSGDRLVRDQSTGKVAATAWLPERTADALANCWGSETDDGLIRAEVALLRAAARVMVTAEEEDELGFAGRRIRGEIFFARRWVLVEGVCEYLLLHAIARASGWPLDAHGVAIIDFQNNGNASIYPSIADAFQIPWRMVTDGDDESRKFRQQLTDRGFTEQELNERTTTLTRPNNLEEQLIADGHEALLREALLAAGHRDAHALAIEDLNKRLKKYKTDCMTRMAARVAADRALAERMPAPFLSVISWLQSDAP